MFNTETNSWERRNVVFDEPFEPADSEKYVSISKQVNTGPNNSVNPERLTELLFKMKEQTPAWTHISPEDILNVPLGAQIRYIKNNTKSLVAGGFLLIKDPMKIYIMYRSHGGSAWSLQVSNINRLWYRQLDRKKKNTKKKDLPEKPAPSIKFKTPAQGNFLYSVEIDGITVYKSNDNYKINRFRETNKYERAVDGNPFELV